MTGLRSSVQRLNIPRVDRDAAVWFQRARRRARHQPSARPDRDTSTIRLLAWTPSYLPNARGGSEVTLHEVLRGLSDRGFTCTVVVPGAEATYRVDDIDVLSTSRKDAWKLAVEHNDLVLAQLDRHTPMVLAAGAGRPFVYWYHIGGGRRSAARGHPDLTVFTSECIREQHAWMQPSFVMHPVIPEDDYATEPGGATTCVNLSSAKGGELFFELAERCDDREFLGVESWGEQVRPARVPENCQVLPMQQDMRRVYERTAILLVPSVYEAYGRVALEAAASGIPTIAHPTPGVREAMGEAALWADRDDPGAWIAQLDRLRDPSFYAERSALARDRFDSLTPAADLDALAARLRQLVTSGPR